MSKTIFLFISLSLLLLLSSCNSDMKSKKEVTTHNAESVSKANVFEVSIDYAEGFLVENHDNYKRLTVFNPWDSSAKLGVYILVNTEHANDVKLKVDEMLIRLPLNRVAIMSSSNIGYFDLLQKMNLIKAVGDENRLYNKYLRERIAESKVKVLGNSVAINKEELIVCNCDAFIQTAYDATSSQDMLLIKAGVPLVYNIDWMEKTPLARAEWIKFIGLLSNENEMADSIFNSIVNNYSNLKDLADSMEYKPDVLIGALYKDVWYMPGGQSFKARMVADAGTNYHWADDFANGSLALSFETVLEQQIDAPIWIEVPFKTKEDLLSSDLRYAYLDAFKIGTMYHHMKRTNITGGNDYWEMGLCRPDELLSDLIRIVHPENMPDGELKYYERVK
ncbi:MAG: ABC transporter substrate-binding protein [Bacteroidales bacterium]|nr:ABC transporter substrate-binding protein [Bacteroidales bacterium]